MTTDHWQPGFSRRDVEVLDRETVYSGFFSLQRVTLCHRRFEGGWTGELQREVLLRPPAVGVLLYDPRRREVVMVEQCRVGALDLAGQGPAGRPDSPWLLELVAGLMEPGESPEQVAHRETLEETGCRIDRLIAMPGYLSSPGGSNERVTLFCGLLDAGQAQGVHGVEAEQEDIRSWRLTVEQVVEAMDTGRLNNAMALIAVQWLLLNENRVRASQCDTGHGTADRQGDIK